MEKRPLGTGVDSGKCLSNLFALMHSFNMCDWPPTLLRVNQAIRLLGIYQWDCLAGSVEAASPREIAYHTA